METAAQKTGTLLRPQAPKDPTGKLPEVYLLLDNVIEGRPATDGGFRDVVYLGGRVAAKLKSVLPDLSEELADRLQNLSGFLALTKRIGVTALAENAENRGKSMHFAIHAEGGGQQWHLETDTQADGRKTDLFVEGGPAGEMILSSMTFEFPIYMTAKVSVTLYLENGTEVPALTLDPPVDWKSDGYRALVERSLISTGNGQRIREALRKLSEGEEITAAFIGGSITQGAAAKPIGTKSYAYRTARGLEEQYAKNGGRVRLVKAGVGGTSSEFGVVRYERDLLRDGTVIPDLLVIEYAVNDLGDETEGIAFESLIRKAVEGPGHPAVILLFSVFMDDWNLEERLVPIGTHYSLPMVSLKRAVTAQFYDEHPVIAKRQYFYDLYHPTNDGHRIMADCLLHLISETAAGQKTAEPVLPAPLLGGWLSDVQCMTRRIEDRFPKVVTIPGGFIKTDAQLQCVEPDDSPVAVPEFADNWMFSGTGEDFVCTLACRDLALVYKDSGHPSFGKAVCFVDEKEVCVIDPLSVGWTHCNVKLLLHDTQCRKHTLRIACENDKKFTILGIAWTGEKEQ